MAAIRWERAVLVQAGWMRETGFDHWEFGRNSKQHGDFNVVKPWIRQSMAPVYGICCDFGEDY